jgi:hypothetical protein
VTNFMSSRPDPPAIRRLCVAIDIESYSKRSIPEQIDLQTRLLWIMTQACKAAGIKPARCDRQDSGDGQLLVLPPSIDESTVLPGLVGGLLTAVRRANESPGSGGRLRLRISVGQGTIQVGATGFASRAVITVARLLDSAELRAALAAAPAADVAVIVTSDLYEDVFSQGYGGLPAAEFKEVRVWIPAKKFAANAWIQVPVNLDPHPKVPAFPDLTALAQRQQRVRDVGAATMIAWAVFMGGHMLRETMSDSAGPQFEDSQHSSSESHTDFGSAHRPETDWQTHQGWANDHAHDLHLNDSQSDDGHSDDGHAHNGHAHFDSESSSGDSWSGDDGFADQVLSVDDADSYDANDDLGLDGHGSVYY